MESGQNVILPNSSAVAEPLNPNPKSLAWNSVESSMDDQRKKGEVENSEDLIGVLEVYIHQARDIHNICIYHNQDVYAKLCLTSDPETTISTQIINGGGKNPIFNENLRLNVRTIDSSLKCEIWMLSRIRNYLEDQLLGFALVPLSDVLIENGKVAQEFSLSSSDLFHSPAGFVELTLNYTGASPEALGIPTPRYLLGANVAAKDSELPNLVPGELDKIEFPDPKIVNENEMMVSEYFGIPCADLDSQRSERLDTPEKENRLSSDIGVGMLESCVNTSSDTIVVTKIETPPSSVSTKESPLVSVSTSSQPVTLGASSVSTKKNTDAVGQAESGSSSVPVSTFLQPIISVNVEPEEKVVQQEIIDMYTKSMQQFTEALAKMKLPMDIEKGSTESGKTVSDEKKRASTGNSPNPSPRVFYGSRAFF